MNIVVAVLLDEFISTVASEKAADKAIAMEAAKAAGQAREHLLDPVIKSLVAFTTEHDLHEKIDEIYERLDLEESGAVDLMDINEGLKKMDYGKPLRPMTEEEFVELHAHGKYLNTDGELGKYGFRDAFVCVCVCIYICNICIYIHIYIYTNI